MPTLSMSGRKGTASIFASVFRLKYEEESLGFLVPTVPLASITVVLPITVILDQVSEHFNQTLCKHTLDLFLHTHKHSCIPPFRNTTAISKTCLSMVKTKGRHVAFTQPILNLSNHRGSMDPAVHQARVQANHYHTRGYVCHYQR